MPNLEIVTSIHSLPRRTVLGGSVNDHWEFLQEAGSTGLQYMPVRSLRRRHMGLRLGIGGFIKSLHQSFITMQSPADHIFHAVIPSLEDSMTPLLTV